MGKKTKLVSNPFSRPKDDDEPEIKIENEENDEEKVCFPSESTFKHIKCKVVRQMKAQTMLKQKKKAKKEAKQKRDQEGKPKGIPHTIESLREKDETMIQGDIDDEANAEVKAEIDNDEFSSYYKKDYEPKVLITYADNPSRKTRIFGVELTRIIPNSLSLYRNRSGVKKMVKSATARGFTDIVVINEDRCRPSKSIFLFVSINKTFVN